MRHEEHAAYAAAAQSELSGGIGVCAGTAGPGALHLINGLYNAQKEGAGVVAITGQVARAERGGDFHKEMDLVRVFGDVCAYQAVIESPSQIPRMAEIAVQKALLERVVTRIELPADVIGQEVPSEHFHHPLVHELRGRADNAAPRPGASSLGLRHQQGERGADWPQGRPRGVEGMARRVPGERALSGAGTSA